MRAFVLPNPSGASLGVDSNACGHGCRSSPDRSLRSRLLSPTIGGSKWRSLCTLTIHLFLAKSSYGSAFFCLFLEQFLLVLGYRTHRVVWDPGSLLIGLLVYLISDMVGWVFLFQSWMLKPLSFHGVWFWIQFLHARLDLVFSWFKFWDPGGHLYVVFFNSYSLTSFW